MNEPPHYLYSDWLTGDWCVTMLNNLDVVETVPDFMKQNDIHLFSRFISVWHVSRWPNKPLSSPEFTWVHLSTDTNMSPLHSDSSQVSRFSHENMMKYSVFILQVWPASCDTLVTSLSDIIMFYHLKVGLNWILIFLYWLIINKSSPDDIINTSSVNWSQVCCWDSQIKTTRPEISVGDWSLLVIDQC